MSSAPKHWQRDHLQHSRHYGPDILRDTKLNKGTAFTLRERQALGIHGLLPPVISSMELQEQRILHNLKDHSPLDKYVQLMDLQDRNEKLFYRMLCNHITDMMPIVYTPTVGLACQRYGYIFRRPRGLFITKHDKGHIRDIIASWPEQNVKAIVVTDGERILGLGDLGCYGMGIPVGKLALYTAIAGVHPSQCLPVMLDVGTDRQELRDDPLYIGLKSKRDRSESYDQLIDEFMEAVVERYGQNCLIQFEDFANSNAFRLLEKYRNKYTVFNDDIQGTASVAVAGLLASLRITKTKLGDNKFLFQGAGEASLGIADLIVNAMQEEGLSVEASLGIADLIVNAMQEEGLSVEDARQRIWLVDSRGLIVKDRPSGGISEHKGRYAHDHKHLTDLPEIVNAVKPTVLIGAAAISGVFTTEILKAMGSFNKRPVIFALSNPTSKAECTAEQAYTHTNGQCVFASGSPFDPFKLPNGKTLIPGQGNNAYVFPGVALGIIAFGIRHVSDSIFLEAAKCIANLVTEAHLDEGRVYPPLEDVREVSVRIAVRVGEYAYDTGMASRYPRPDDMEAYVRKCIYDYEYESFTPDYYDWPATDSKY